MNKHINPTVIKELYLEWLKWSVWLYAVVGAVRIGFWIGDYFGEVDPAIDYFIYFLHESNRVFMLVVGIMMVYTFLRYYIEHGLTRKNYFFGGLIASVLVSLTTAVISFILSALENIPIQLFGYEYGEHVVSHGLGYWIGFFFLFVVTSWLFFLVGWFIGHAFYRYGWVTGMVAVLAAFIFGIIENLATGEGVELFEQNFAQLSVPLPLTILILLILCAVAVLFNNRQVMDIPVKMK